MQRVFYCVLCETKMAGCRSKFAVRGVTGKICLQRTLAPKNVGANAIQDRFALIAERRLVFAQRKISLGI
jgi:hypothetical protein